MSNQVATKKVGFGATLASEWTKLISLAAPKRNLVLGIVLGLGLSLLLSIVTAATIDQWPEPQVADYDPIMYPLSGLIIGSIFFVVFGVNAVAPEYASGMIRQTFTVTPKRSRVILAKALAVYIATAVANLLAVVAMIGSADLILSSSGVPSVDWAGVEVWQTIAAVTVVGPMMPLLALAVGFLLRNAAAAISTMIALLFLPFVIGALLPLWWQENVVSLFPSNVNDALMMGHLNDAPQYLDTPVAAVAAVVWLVLAYAVTRLVVNKRDVQ